MIWRPVNGLARAQMYVRPCHIRYSPWDDDSTPGTAATWRGQYSPRFLFLALLSNSRPMTTQFAIEAGSKTPCSIAPNERWSRPCEVWHVNNHISPFCFNVEVQKVNLLRSLAFFADLFRSRGEAWNPTGLSHQRSSVQIRSRPPRCKIA